MAADENGRKCWFIVAQIKPNSITQLQRTNAEFRLAMADKVAAQSGPKPIAGFPVCLIWEALEIIHRTSIRRIKKEADSVQCNRYMRAHACVAVWYAYAFVR